MEPSFFTIACQPLSEEFLWQNVPKDRFRDVDYLLDLIDWELNLDSDFFNKRFMSPVPVRPLEKMKQAGYIEKWIVYKSQYFSAKELMVLPGRTVTIKDSGAYGMIMMQGFGKMGVWNIESPTMIRYGQLTQDEYFVGEQAAKRGVKITNLSATDPIVMLKHFGPGSISVVN